jgi:glycerol-3-phosphate dehydrogenase
MRRDVMPFAKEIYDVIVVGGGIHGACAAWEAARRGLKVVLVEAGDFNAATSANSLRTLHGGLRHLQRLDFQQMRLSIRQRREWLRLAPELTRPLRFVLPLSSYQSVARVALWVNDWISADRNKAVRQDHHLPGGSILTRNEFAQLFPGLSVTDFDVAAAWYDGICLDTERLQLAVIAAAVACGAQVANYVRALWPLRDGVRICGARISDELTGAGMDLRAPVVINAAGPELEAWLPRAQSPLFKASKAFNLLVRRLPFQDALGLRMGGGTYFVIPWNGYSIVGTRHLHGDHLEVSRAEVAEFLAQLNPLLGLTIDDVYGVFSGLLPAESGGRDVALERAPRIVDHTKQGLRGLYSIVGVKWTTALSVGEAAASRACQQLGRSKRPVRERALDLSGAGAPTGGDAARVVPDLPVVFGQIAHAVREEMAVHLWDVVRRRTPLYLSRSLDHAALVACASVMARELRWSPRTTAAEIDMTEAELVAFKGPLRAASRPVAA